MWVFKSILFSDTKGRTASTVCGDDYLVILMKEVLGQCEEKKEALHTLEQIICDKIRAVKELRFSSFQELSGVSFRKFIENNADHFAIEYDGQHYIVSSKKRRKKKKKKSNGSTGSRDGEALAPRRSECFGAEASINDTPVSTVISDQPWYRETDDHEEDEHSQGSPDRSPWELVSRKTVERKKNDSQLTIRQQSRDKATRENSSSCLSGLVNTRHLLIQNLIKQPSSDTLIFRVSDAAYKQDRTQFIKDVTSLWNTPQRGTAYIVMGVQFRSKPPHRLEGLQSPTDESVYQSMFQKGLLSNIPEFRYWEIMCGNARIGVVEIESNPSCGSPSIVTSDDMAASSLKKGQLLARKNGRNVLVLPTEPLHGKIHKWFKNKKARDSDQGSIPHKVDSPAPRAISSSRQSYTQAVQRPPHQPATKHPVQQDKSYAAVASPSAPSKAQQLLKALNNFQKVHFVLICGSMRIASSKVEALAGAPWIAVYDFNVLGRDSGLLSILEEGIMRRRSLSVLTWCDSCRGITEKGTQWWSLRGRREIPESHTPDSFQDWFMQVKDKLEKLCLELTRFAEDYTVLSILVLWPESELEARCIHKFLTKLQEHVHSKIILCFPDSTKDYTQSKAATIVRLEFEESIQEFHVALEDFCAEVERLIQVTVPQEKFEYQLPSAESTLATLKEEDSAWLAQDLEVLYLQSSHTKVLTDQDLEAEADTFFRGGAINWFILYDKKYEHFDVKRVVAKDITMYIQKEFLEDGRNGMVTVYHAPGAGGSTMTRRVLWDLHERAPCVHVKQRSGSSMDEIVARLVFLYDKCRVPVIALMDGEDENRVKQLSRQLQRHNVIILYAKRYPYSFDNVKVPKGTFYLPGTVQHRESSKLVQRYMQRCEGDQQKIDALLKLDKDVEQGVETHQMYEYGMTVYHHEFQGVRAYVRGYLQVEESHQRELQPWQRCLGFLALVNYYGQSSLPCQFFVNLLGKQPNYKLDLHEDFPHQVKVFVVQDSVEGKSQCIRIGHYIIAKEILEQVLVRRIRHSSGKGDRLSQDARRKLKDFSISFISEATKKKIKTSLTSQTISHILAKTFIFRDNEEMSDMDAQSPESQTKRKPQFSQIMTDLDSDPPYHGRLEVLQKLCDTFPNDPNFRAHLGRFYTCCRPEAEEEAEKHFKEALRLCSALSPGKEAHDMDEKSKLTLMHIYHMYGMFFQARINKFIKSCPDLRENRSRFEEMLDLVVDNACRACENFVDSRNATPSGHEESYIYANEIHVRLQTCEFVNRYFPGGLRDFLGHSQTVGDTNYDTARAFITESVTEIDSLIMECYDVQVDNVFQLQKYVAWFHSLFSSCTLQLQTLLRTDRLATLRLTITATKLKYHRPDDIIWVDSPMPEEDVLHMVNLLEQIFEEEMKDNSRGRNREKSKLELDYKDWILAIRHPQLKQVRFQGDFDLCL